MTGGDLMRRQAEALFATVYRHRRYLELLYARWVAAGFPADDPLLLETRRSLLAYRELALVANDGRAKGVQRQYLKRAAAWPAV